MFFIVVYKMYFFLYKLCVCVCYLIIVYRFSDYWNLLINFILLFYKCMYFYLDIFYFFNIVILKVYY